VGISRQRNSDYKVEQGKHCGTKSRSLPSPNPFLSPYTCLSLSSGLWPESKQVGWRSQLQE